MKFEAYEPGAEICNEGIKWKVVKELDWGAVTVIGHEENCAEDDRAACKLNLDESTIDHEHPEKAQYNIQQTCDCEDLKPSFLMPQVTEKVELIHSQRLWATRDLRAQVCEFIRHKVQYYPIPDGKTLWFDYLAAGPFQFVNMDQCQHRTDLYHKLGEFDLAVKFWLHQFQHLPTVVYSADSDFLCVFMLYLAANPNRKVQQVYWQRSANEIVSMNQLCEKLLSVLGLTAEEFVEDCVFDGTDFTDKSKLMHGIGYIFPFQATQIAKAYVQYKQVPPALNRESFCTIHTIHTLHSRHVLLLLNCLYLSSPNVS